MSMRGLLLALGLASAAGAAGAETLTVCPAGASDRACRFVGDGAIQAAVDAARDGDTIRLKAGRYSPAAYRDVPFQDIAARGYVVIARKRLDIEGEPGVVLDGAKGAPSIAFVLDHADVRLRDLVIRDFRLAEPEDKIYDGHGVFAISSRVRLERVRMERIIKMALTGRGDTLIDASDIQLLDGHMGVWLEESAHAHIRNAVIRGGDSAGVGAYMNASANLYNSVIEANGDDGLYATGQGVIFATNSLILGNKPLGLNAVEQGRITLVHSVLYGNASDLKPDAGPAVRLGDGVLRTDPMVDAAWRPRPGSPLLGKSDPDLGRPIGLMGEAR